MNIKESFFIFSNDILATSLIRHFFPSNRGVGVDRKPFMTDTYHVYYSDDEDNFNTGDDTFENRFNTIKGFLVYGLKEKVFTADEIVDAYEYNSDDTRERFIAEVEQIQKSIKTQIKRNNFV